MVRIIVKDVLFQSVKHLPNIAGEQKQSISDTSLILAVCDDCVLGIKG